MIIRPILFGAAAASALLVAATQLPAAETAVRLPAPALAPKSTAPSETATFAGGCFWGVQGVFQHVKGVKSAVSGYTGGASPAPDYDRVSTGTTGHAEAVRVTFDPQVVSYAQLLHVYFSVVADPTSKNFQGPDHGTQYRSALFPASPVQASVARAYIAQLGRTNPWQRPIVTTLEPVRMFYPAESYHQDYLTLHPDAGYIRVNDMPKVAALKTLFPTQYRSQAVLVASR